MCHPLCHLISMISVISVKKRPVVGYFASLVQLVCWDAAIILTYKHRRMMNGRTQSHAAYSLYNIIVTRLEMRFAATLPSYKQPSLNGAPIRIHYESYPDNKDFQPANYGIVSHKIAMHLPYNVMC